QGADMFAGNELGQVFALLQFAAVATKLIDAEVGMRAVGQSDRRGSARNLLHRHAMMQIAEAGTAVFFFDGDPVQAERAHFRPEVAWKDVVAIDLVGARRNTVLRKSRDRPAQHIDIGPETEIEPRPDIGDHAAVSTPNTRHAMARSNNFIAWTSGCQRLNSTAGGLAAGMRQKPIDDLGGRRLGEEEALHLVAAGKAQQDTLFFRLHSLD